MTSPTIHAYLHVHSNPVEGREADFDAWYSEIHIPQILERIEGFAAARRLVLAPTQVARPSNLPGLRYLTIYDIDTPDVEAALSRLRAGLRDGTLEPSDAMDVRDTPPQMQVYAAVGA